MLQIRTGQSIFCSVCLMKYRIERKLRERLEKDEGVLREELEDLSQNDENWEHERIKDAVNQVTDTLSA